MKSVWHNYLQLTKPRVMTLVILSGATALFMEGSLLGHPLKFLLVLAGLYLAGGAANALNQYFERDIDARMTRTRKRRPLPMGRLKPAQALAFSVVIGITSILLFALVFNWLAAFLALATILFYGFFYTLWLKPNTDHNIVIGGAAGAMAPLIAWAAATGSLAVAPAILFLIVFVWTPPHFWALALYFKDDYEKVELPMLPVVRGENVARLYIFIYTLALFMVSLALIAVGAGLIYIAAAVGLGFVFIRKAFNVFRHGTRELQRGLFGYSIFYLFGLFLAIIIDSLVL
jgi:protoheme IX farnesyltransferase